jgi:uncharacterized membrane protein YvbJ
MVFCSKCGTKNEDFVKYCIQCGVKMSMSKSKNWDQRMEEWGEGVGKRMETWGEDMGKRAEEWGEDFRKHAEKECFGLPHGSIIVGLVIGILIIIAGVTSLSNVDLKFWPLAIIVFGLLILVGAAYPLLKKN